MVARHPPTPETWAAVMYMLLGLCTLGVLGMYFLGAVPGRTLLWILLLIGLAAFSVTVRWLGSPGRRE